jgi:signal transduction histidine kinase/CheY-like chemotaxis protein
MADRKDISTEDDEIVLFDSAPLIGRSAGGRVKALEQKIERLEKINRVLMQRVEQTVDPQGNPFSLFQTAILLEDVVNERTDRLRDALQQIEKANHELRIAKETAEEADLSKTRFLAAATHDLLQPLNAARLSISILTDELADSDASKLVTQTEHSLETVERLLRALLDISKLDAGVMRPHIGGLALQKILESLQIDFSPTAEARGLELRVVPSSFFVRSDAVLIHRILQNFVSNALRYTTEGKVLVGCRVKEETVRIEVWDTGIGIDPDEHEAIFEEFYRIGASHEGNTHRLGLGLAIVTRIARVLGHEIGLRSYPGEGSVFWVDIPLWGRQRKGASDTPARSPLPDRLLNDCVVAVIEDDENVLEALDMRLQRWGCETIIAKDVDALVDRVNNAGKSPDIIVADYHLGDNRTGLDAIHAIRQLHRFEVPAVVVTADHSPSTYQRVLLANCQPMTKPVNPAELRTVMNSLINAP